MLLRDKICFVSGAGKGLGRATVNAFVREGAFVYANDLEMGSLNDLAGDPQVATLYFDVADGQADKEAILRIRREKGRLDVLVNNAGLMTGALIGTISRSLRGLFLP